jgi:RNA polymerase sigma factor (sigma-70 family)
MTLRASHESTVDGASRSGTGEPRLLERLKRRDAEAQATLLRRESPGLRATAMSILASEGDALPLVADVFTDFLYTYVDRIEHERAIPAYLRIMVVRRARRLLQRRSQEDSITAHDLADASGRDVVEVLEAKSWLPWLEDCSSQLTERARRVLRLHFGHDMGTVEIAGAVGVTKQAVSKTIIKCIAQLRRCLERKRSRAERRQP